jgi:D-tyrosyl-tRNA(Tyr) deacylase
VLQRVTRASVTVDGDLVAMIGEGLCLLVGIEAADSEGEVRAAVDKIVGLRVFGDESGKMNLDLGDIGGEVLVVSQFTLFGDVRKGRRPSFTGAGPPDHAEPLIVAMAKAFDDLGIVTMTGVFGAKMTLHIENDGPVTLILEIRDGRAQ